MRETDYSIALGVEKFALVVREAARYCCARLSPTMNHRWLRVVLGLIALLMVADFVFRGVGSAAETTRNDFSEVYVGSWLWRHGQNFYDSSLTKATATQLTGSHVNLVLIYPPTALALMSPFSFLPWFWANTVWLVVGLAAVATTILLLLRLAGFQLWEDRALILGTFVLAFSPLHQAFHMGNVALVAVPLSLLGIYLAEAKHDFAAGVILTLATALKPQLGRWVLLFYLIQFRKRFVAGMLLPAAVLLVALVSYPVPARTLISGYRSNLHYWFDPGRMIGFTEGAMPFHVNTSQVILYQFLHRVALVNVLAQSLFIFGLMAWLFTVWRARFQVSIPLAISSLLALSFISIYHSVSDVTILTLALCWAFRDQPALRGWSQRATCILFLLMMLPGHSLLIRSAPHLSASIADSWWWKLLVARYFIWLLLALNAVLLYALVRSSAAGKSLEAQS
jgi:hypothetical protein